MIYDYDKTSKKSILEFSKRLLGKTLEEAVAPDVIDPHRGKGNLGQLVEVYFFGIENNTRQEADFPQAGLELKVTPLKELKSKALQIKERLVCTMIDFNEDYKYSFEESHFYLKCAYMLILFYLHQANVPAQQLKFLFSVLWQVPAKDLLIMKQDYDKIMTKIKEGRAHEISEGDTTYLGACRKGEKGDKDVTYTLPDGSKAAIPAPKRAFALKTTYMRTVLEFAETTGGQGTYNKSAIVKGYGPQLVDEHDLRKKSFEEIVLARFEPYYGMDYQGILSAIGVKPSKAKSKYFLVTNEIITEGETLGKDVLKSEEFRKSGILIKTIRLTKTGRPAEAMSFENIRYFDVLNEEDWYDSRLYEIFTQRFLFVVFQEESDGSTRLKKAFFWTMPPSDLKDAEAYWENIKQCIRDNHISSEYFFRESDHRKFHVRPKARNAADLADNPNGGRVRKYCYWFNLDYIKDIISKA